MRVLNLTTWERVQLLSSIPRDAPLREIPKHLRVMDILTLSEKEKEAIKFRQTIMATPEGPRPGNTWDDQKRKWELEFEDADYAHLVKTAKARSKWPTDDLTTALMEKLEIEMA